MLALAARVRVMVKTPERVGAFMTDEPLPRVKK